MSDPGQLASGVADLQAQTAGLTSSGAFNGTVGATTPTTGNFTYARQSVDPSVIPAGTTRADAYAITAAINVAQTVGASTGVVLPLASEVGVGGSVVIYNAGANPMQVYAQGSETIDAGAGATGVPLTNAKRCMYTVWGSINWVSAQLGVPSA